MKISRRGQLIFGVALFFMGVAAWLAMGPVLLTLMPEGELPKYLSLVAFVVPLSIASWREHAQGRTRRIGYLVTGWLFACGVVGGFIYLALTLIGPLPRG